MTARDCELYVADTLSSLARQTHDELQLLFVDDASSDDTGRIARQLMGDLFPGRHHYVRNDAPWGKARNAHVHLRALAPQADFIAVLDGDDQLIVPDILARMAAQYAAGVDVVWTNYVTDRGQVGSNGPLDANRPPRTQGWKTSHFFSFRAALLAQVDESYFQATDGAWLMAACDFALAFPILDQTRRYHYIAEQAYRYTATNPASHHNADPAARGLNSTLQMANAREVLGKKPLPCTRTLEPVSAPPAAVSSAERPSRISVFGENYWAMAAAQQLAQACPSLLALPGLDAIDPLQAHGLWRRVMALPEAPRVLELGHGPWAAVLAVMVQARGGRFWSLGLDERETFALEARLRAGGASQHASLGTTRLVASDLLGTPGHFPDLRMLETAAGFDLVLVAAAQVIRDLPSATHALPALAERLSPEGFGFCLQTPSLEMQRHTTKVWEALADDLHYVESACAGLGLWVGGKEPG